MSLAGLPSYRSGVPQEGPLRWPCDDGVEREMRLGIFPTVHGNRAAIRIMNERETIRQLDQLGFDSDTVTNLQIACDSRDGWLLVAGPAGSGKTTTLYACLTYIASGEFCRSVLTIEDPIESVIDSVSQSQLQSASGLTLAAAMRAAVRQDAEVLLVSEIRDVETAEAVLAASMTGHLCFSSIHAGSIGSTLRRLVQMDLPTYAIQSGLRGILCQRLLRKTCRECRGNPECPHCHGTGYHGRVPIAQLISFDGSKAGQSVFDALVDHQPAMTIDSIASQSGIESLAIQAARLVDNNQTDRAEVFRVLGRSA
jgi:type II secretory ATPase GspE/PulE/Tfp pilus assembly ATPase PilB-like protein